MSTRLPDPRPAVVQMCATLATWLVSWRIEQAAGLRIDMIVLATMMALTLSQSLDRVPVTGRLRHRAVTLLVVPVVAVAATEVGRLLAAHQWWGGAAFCLALALAVWVRRFGSLWTRLGSLATLPFITLLVAPVAPGGGLTLWPAVLAVVAVVLVLVARLVGGATGFLPRRGITPAAVRRRTSRRVIASTSMAIQLLVGLLVSYTAGRWLFPEHWPWAVLSCYVVCSGARGRGDVLHKGILRLAGALAGTVAATVIASPFPPGDRIAVALIFVVMAIAVWLRSLSYAYWAAGVTAILALLQGFEGVGGLHTLDERLIGVTLGAVIAVLVSWFVLPIRSRDSFRARWADALAALGDLVGALRRTPQDAVRARAALVHATRELERLEPAYLFHRRTVHRWLPPHDSAHPADLVALLRAVVVALEGVALDGVDKAPDDVLTGWARQVGGVRRRMRAEESEPVLVPAAGQPALEAVSEALAALDRAFTTATWRQLGGAVPEIVTEVRNETGVAQPRGR